MTRSYRLVLPLLLSLMLVLTGQGFAASRGLNTAVGQMVLCTGNGPVVVYMDEHGQPTKPPHFCPDYALNLLGAVLDTPLPAPKGPERAKSDIPLRSDSLVAAPIPQRPARAPPAPV